jgi:hypothetical protein
MAIAEISRESVGLKLARTRLDFVIGAAVQKPQKHDCTPALENSSRTIFFNLFL